MNHSRLYLGLTASLAAATSTLAVAQEDSTQGYVIEEVQVTAQRRTERALDVPISITALGAEQLGKGDVQQLGDIAKLTPGMRFDNQGGNAQPTIRGVGSSVVIAGAGANIAVYTDGFYSPNPIAADSELLNIESIQVLKGPQGTLFGRNSTGGAILVTTKDPSGEESGFIRESVGNYGARRSELYVTGGPSEDLAFDFARLDRDGDGYLENINTGDDEVGSYDNRSVRLGAFWQVNDSLSFLLRYTKAEIDDPSVTAVNFYEKGGRVYSYAGTIGANVSSEPHEIANNYPFGYTSESEATQLRIKLDLGFAMLTSYTQSRNEEGIHDYDFDGSALSIYHYHFETTDDIFTQEFLLTSQGDGPLQWTTGLFYMEDETVYPNNQASVGGAPFVPTGGTGIIATSTAVFADVTYALLDNLFVTLGARYSIDELEDAYYISTVTSQKVDVEGNEDDKVTPRVAVRYELNDNSSVYTSYTEGFKSSIINLAGSNLLGTLINDLNVDQEEIQAYEVGYKYSGDRLMLDVAIFKYDYQDLQQVSYFGIDTLINNAATSSIFGVDFQSRYALADGLEVTFGIAYLDAEYDDYEESQAWTQCLTLTGCFTATDYGFFYPGYVDGSGNEMLRSPEITANLGASYLLDLASAGTLEFSGNVYYTDDFYFDTSEVYEQESYHLLSARIEWADPSDSFSVALYGDNLTDEEYLNSLLPQFYGALSTWGAPRTYGLSGEYRF